MMYLKFCYHKLLKRKKREMRSQTKNQRALCVTTVFFYEPLRSENELIKHEDLSNRNAVYLDFLKVVRFSFPV